MILNLHKSVSSLIVFGLLFLLGLALSHPDPADAAALSTGPGLLIYLLALCGLGLSVVFNRSREFSVFLLILGAYAVLRLYVWSPDANAMQKTLSVGLIALLLPLNFFIADVLRERGIFSSHGVLRLLIIVVQASTVLLLMQIVPQSLYFTLQAQLTHASWITAIQLPQIAIWFAAVTGFWLLFRSIRQPSCLQNGLLFAAIAMMIGLHYHRFPDVTGSWIVLAEIGLIAGIVLNSYSRAYLDELTGLPTRRALRQHLAQLNRRYALAIVDVDHFKKINDSFGYEVGDQVLRMVSAEIRRITSARGFRFGGEEFALVFAGKDGDETKVMMEILRQRVAERAFFLRSLVRPSKRPINPRQTTRLRRVAVTISVGVAEKLSRHADSVDVLKAANRALFRAKQGGRNLVEQQEDLTLSR